MTVGIYIQRCDHFFLNCSAGENNKKLEEPIMKNSKRLVTLLLALVMLVGMFTVAASATEPASLTLTFDASNAPGTGVGSYTTTVKEGGSYKMSILKADGAEPPQCRRFFYWYPAMAGHGHFIHTYQGDGNPLPSFAGEPTEVEIKGDIDEFAANGWESLNEDNKVSLFVRYIDMATGEMETRIFNKNE